MLSKIGRFLQECMVGKLYRCIQERIGMKLLAVLAPVILALMIIGAFLVARMMTDGQYRALETRGREMGRLLGKAGAEALLHRDIMALDGLIAETVKSEDVLFAYISDGSNAILSNAYVSFNRAHPEVQEFLAQETIDDVAALAAKAKEKLSPVTVQVDIKNGTTRLGAVTMGFSRARVRSETMEVIWMLLGIGGMLIGALSLMVYVMVRTMIVAPAREAVAVASNIAAGDLSHRVRVRSMDELGSLGLGLRVEIARQRKQQKQRKQQTRARK